jgi:hypothetical protein
MSREELLLNVEKRCVLLCGHGLYGKEATIKDVVGDSINGYQYHVVTDTPKYSFTTKTDFYPSPWEVRLLN